MLCSNIGDVQRTVDYDLSVHAHRHTTSIRSGLGPILAVDWHLKLDINSNRERRVQNFCIQFAYWIIYS